LAWTISPLPGFEFRTVHPLACGYKNSAIPALTTEDPNLPFFGFYSLLLHVLAKPFRKVNNFGFRTDKPLPKISFLYSLSLFLIFCLLKNYYNLATGFLLRTCCSCHTLWGYPVFNLATVYCHLAFVTCFSHFYCSVEIRETLSFEDHGYNQLKI
jgi:hypothetical protein